MHTRIGRRHIFPSCRRSRKKVMSSPRQTRSSLCDFDCKNKERIKTAPSDTNFVYFRLLATNLCDCTQSNQDCHAIFHLARTRTAPATLNRHQRHTVRAALPPHFPSQAHRRRVQLPVRLQDDAMVLRARVQNMTIAERLPRLHWFKQRVGFKSAFRAYSQSI